MKTYHLESDVCDVLTETIPYGQRSNYVSVVLANDLRRILEAKKKAAESENDLAKINASLSRLKRAVDSIREAVEEAETPKAKLRRLVLKEEAQIE